MVFYTITEERADPVEDAAFEVPEEPGLVGVEAGVVVPEVPGLVAPTVLPVSVPVLVGDVPTIKAS